MITVLVGQVMVLALGASLVAILFPDRDAPARNAIVIGYGYPVGSVFLTLWMRALSAVGVDWGWLTVGVPMLAAIALGLWQLRRQQSRLLLPLRLSPDDASYAGLPARAGARLWWILLALIALHLAFAGLEILWRPLFPWDAWTQWATKARVWYESLHMVRFGTPEAWFTENAYTDAIPNYPANLPLLQVWACLTLGRWDDSLMNLPFLFFGFSLATSLYGQLRQFGLRELPALAGAYFAISLPLLDTHIALAGYADLPLAVYFTLAAIALWRWTSTKARSQLVLAAILAIACPLTKYPGWAWVGVLASCAIAARFPRRGVWLVVGFIAIAIAGMALLGHSQMTIGGYRMGAFRPVWEPLWQNYFEFANWHLLWYLLPVAMILDRRRILDAETAPGTAMLASGLSFLFVAFSFSNAADFVTDYSTVNRATLHLAPFLVFYLMVLVDQLLRVVDAARVSAPPAAV